METLGFNDTTRPLPQSKPLKPRTLSFNFWTPKSSWNCRYTIEVSLKPSSNFLKNWGFLWILTSSVLNEFLFTLVGQPHHPPVHQQKRKRRSYLDFFVTRRLFIEIDGPPHHPSVHHQKRKYYPDIFLRNQMNLFLALVDYPTIQMYTIKIKKNDPNTSSKYNDGTNTCS